MTMNPTMNHPNKVNLMDEKKYNSVTKTPATQTGGTMHGGNGTGSIGGTSAAAPQRGSTTPIFIDIDNLDLTIICGNQENYHENINGGFGCMQGGQQMGCYDEDCDCCDDDFYDDDWDDDDFDEPAAPEDTEAPCNTCDFSAECLKRSIESGDNIFLAQIIRKMAYISGVPLDTVMRVLDAYLTLCSIFDEEPPVRFKKIKYDVHRIPVGLDDLTNRIHKAATSLAYGLADSESICAEEKAEKSVTPKRSAQHQHNDQSQHSVQGRHSVQSQQEENRSKKNTAPTHQGECGVGEAKPNAEEGIPSEILDALPEPVRAILRDAPDELKQIVSRACEKGKKLHIIHIDVKGEAEDDGDTAEAQDDDPHKALDPHKSTDSDNSPENIIPMT